MDKKKTYAKSMGLARTDEGFPTFGYVKLAAKEFVTVEFEGHSCVPVLVTDRDLLGIVLEVVKAVQRH